MEYENVHFTIELQFNMEVPQEKHFDHVGGYVKIKDKEVLAKVGLDYLMSEKMATNSTPLHLLIKATDTQFRSYFSNYTDVLFEKTLN